MIEKRSNHLLEALESRVDTLLERVRQERNTRQALQQRLAELEAATAAAAAKSPMCRTTDKSGSYDAAAHADTAAAHADTTAADANAPSPQALLAEWYRRYPNAFFKGHTRPLMVGIHEPLMAREPWPEKLVRRALACYVNLPRYLKSVREGVERIDLAGQPAGRVDAEAAGHARGKLARLQAERRGQPATPDEREASRALRAPSEDLGESRGESRRKQRREDKNRLRRRAEEPGSSRRVSTHQGAEQQPLQSAHDEASAAGAAAPRPVTLDEKLAALVAKHQGR